MSTKYQELVRAAGRAGRRIPRKGGSGSPTGCVGVKRPFVITKYRIGRST